MKEIEVAWNAVHDATPTGWCVGRPSLHNEPRQWVMYAFDPSERPSAGLRSREWTAVGATDVEAVAKMRAAFRSSWREGRGSSSRGSIRAGHPRADDPALCLFRA